MIRTFEPAPVHRGEHARNGNRVLGVRGERRGGRQPNRPRITPPEAALHCGLDREDCLRVHRSVERAGDRPVERDRDDARRRCLVSWRRAEDLQRRLGRRCVCGEQQRAGVQRTHNIARKEGQLKLKTAQRSQSTVRNQSQHLRARWRAGFRAVTVERSVQCAVGRADT